MGWTDILRRALPSWLKEPGPDSRLPPATVKEQDESDCPVLWATPVGEFWGRLADGRLLDFLVNEQERQKTYQRGPVVIRPGDVVLDVGAHLGTFTRIALRDGAAKIVAFEIEPVSIRCFKKTFRKELAEGLVVLVEEAAWESSGMLALREDHNNSAAASVHEVTSESSGEQVPATTIDDVVVRLGLEQVDFIKMDIEGAERHAVRGAARTLSRFAPRLALCIYHKDDDPLVIPQQVLQIKPDYQVFTTEVAHAFFY